MIKIAIVSVLVIFLMMFCSVSVSHGGLELKFDFYNVSDRYMKFYYEFGSQFGELKKKYSFFGNYTISVLEGMGTIRYEDGIEEEDLVIVVRINNEENPLWVRVKNLSSEEKIKKKAKEFAEKTFKKLKELER